VVGLQLKLPCATLDDVRARYGTQLKQNRLFVRTRQPRPKDTLVRLEASFSSGAPCFRAAAVVVLVIEPPQPGTQPPPGTPEPGMGLSLLAVDEAGRQLIESLGGKPPAALKEASRPPPPQVPPNWQASQPPKPAPGEPHKEERTGVHFFPHLAAEGERPTPAGGSPTVETGQPQVGPAQPQPSTPPGLHKFGKGGPVIGIDLGTTNSAAAVLLRGKPTVIQSREGYNTLPSVVALGAGGKLLVGHAARKQLLTNPANTVYGAKRLVGRPYTSPVVQEMRSRFPYWIEAGPKGEAAVRLGEETISLEQIQALILKEVKDVAQAALGTEITRAVVTVPAYYNDNQRQAVRAAGKIAGIEVVRILNEPTAAALAFAHGRFLEQRVLVYDLGGGTFDASVLELHGNVYEVLATGGDTFLGGVDFDRALADHLIAGFEDQHKLKFDREDRAALMRVQEAAERAKIALSEGLEARVHVPFLAQLDGQGVDLDTVISRSELVLVAGHLVDRTLKVCVEVLADKGLQPRDINEVLLVGGQSRMPLVRERIRQLFGREPNKVVHPDEAVALGAALLADSMTSGQITGVVLVDVLSMSIGVGLRGGRFKRILEHNTPLPHRRNHQIHTTRDDQTTLEVAVFQGESDRALDNEYLGTLTVEDLPPGPKGSVGFDVAFALTAEALLTVTAEQHGTGRLIEATFATRETPDAIRARLGDDFSAERLTQIPNVVEEPPPAPVAAPPPPPSGGVRGFFRRLFGGRANARP
jgi:molecular chaperone DnaK